MKNSLEEMAAGQLYLSGNELITYQAGLIKGAKERIYAIHLALDEKSVKRWDKKQTTKDFTTILIKANKKTALRADKRRIFIIDVELLEKPELKKIWKKIIREQKRKMLFRVRFITRKSCEEDNRGIPCDMLICDKEAVTVHFYDQRARGEIYKNREKVDENLELFEQYWEWAQKKLLI